MVALLVQNLERLDESVKEEADGVHNTLGEDEGSQVSLCLGAWCSFPFLLHNRVKRGSVFFPFAPKLPFWKWSPLCKFHITAALGWLEGNKTGIHLPGQNRWLLFSGTLPPKVKMKF